MENDKEDISQIILNAIKTNGGISRYEAKKFIVLHSIPEKNKSHIRTEENKINGVIETAISQGHFSYKKNVLNSREFFLWATEKTIKGKLRWPILKEILPPLFPPDISSLVLQITNRILPAESEMESTLIEYMDEALKLKKEKALLKKENEELRIKIRQAAGSHRGLELK